MAHIGRLSLMHQTGHLNGTWVTRITTIGWGSRSAASAQAN